MRVAIKDLFNLIQFLQPRIEAGYRNWSQGGSTELTNLISEQKAIFKLFEECKLGIEIPEDVKEIIKKYHMLAEKGKEEDIGNND